MRPISLVQNLHLHKRGHNRTVKGPTTYPLFSASPRAAADSVQARGQRRERAVPLDAPASPVPAGLRLLLAHLGRVPENKCRCCTASAPPPWMSSPTARSMQPRSARNRSPLHEERRAANGTSARASVG